MAAAAVQISTSLCPGLAQKPSVPVSDKSHYIQTTLNFFKENKDCSPPSPSYVGKPETYEKPTV
jgi:hypothetical protein